MFRGGRGTQQGGFLVWLPLARSIRVSLVQAHNVVYLSKCLIVSGLMILRLTQIIIQVNTIFSS
ncbi:hypothetical protein DXF97_32975 [Klebsiella pneumoniae]|nr:hypothetical protein DXF97_32975 [Klebsiella pneumoniae]